MKSGGLSHKFQIPNDVLGKTINHVKKRFPESPADVDFFGRTFSDGNLEKYSQRINLIGFEGQGRILDLGCGFGQWSFTLALNNASVVGADIDQQRIEIANLIKTELDFPNVNFDVAQIAQLLEKYGVGSFDGVFAYIAIPYMLWRESLKDIVSILRPGGMLYFTAYDLGWPYLNIAENHNPSENFDPRQWAIETIENTLSYEKTGQFKQHDPKSSVYIPQKEILEYLSEIGFTAISSSGDGQTDVTGANRHLSFYDSHYRGILNVYEVLCQKL